MHFKFTLQITCRCEGFHNGVAENSRVLGHGAVAAGPCVLGLPYLILTDMSISSYKMLHTMQHHIPVNLWKQRHFKVDLISKLTQNTSTVRISILTLLSSVSSWYSVQPSWAERSERSLWSWPHEPKEYVSASPSCNTMLPIPLPPPTKMTVLSRSASGLCK